MSIGVGSWLIFLIHMINLNCRGLACPAPVLQTNEAIEKEHPSIIKVTVDNEAEKQKGEKKKIMVMVANDRMVHGDADLGAKLMLSFLEQDGLQIMVCGTCLTYFNLLDDKQVGETTNMLDIVMAMQLADKVINI